MAAAAGEHSALPPAGDRPKSAIGWLLHVLTKRLTAAIMVGLVLGIAAGWLVNQNLLSGVMTTEHWVRSFHVLSNVFLNLIKMLIAPLVLASIVSGLAHMGDSTAVGRIGVRAIAWFIVASLVSISLGLVMVNLFQPGAGVDITAPAPAVGEVSKLDMFEFIEHVFPKNIIQAMADNNVLQILVFALFAGIGLMAIGERGRPLVRGAEALTELMLEITGYVMRFAPFAVFGALAATVAENGLGILIVYARLLGEFYLALLILWLLLLLAGFAVLRGRAFSLVRYVRQPVLIAFSTASSEAAMPKLFEQLDRFGVPQRVSGLMVPLGYSFNLDGSMMYSSFATIFIAQAYGIQLSIGTQIAILLTLMVSSKGIAAVPRASLVVIAATLAMFDLPVEGIALVLAIDHFLDMGRTATNVWGNAVATSVITKWEGMLQPLRDPDLDDPVAPHHTPEQGRAGLNLDPEN